MDLVLRISGQTVPVHCDTCPCHDTSDTHNEYDMLFALENCCPYCDLHAAEREKLNPTKKEEPKKKAHRKKKKGSDDDDDDDDDYQ
jgi:hypothetical protein